ncbi:MAG: hypothetical protein ISS92_02600 [Candidatus Omnitrophica bacterium]|nr:hypothetical protein [Candidatus Omnitrophota bacterium]
MEKKRLTGVIAISLYSLLLAAALLSMFIVRLFAYSAVGSFDQKVIYFLYMLIQVMPLAFAGMLMLKLRRWGRVLSLIMHGYVFLLSFQTLITLTNYYLIKESLAQFTPGKLSLMLLAAAGVLVSSVIIYYLTRPKVREMFT